MKRSMNTKITLKITVNQERKLEIFDKFEVPELHIRSLVDMLVKKETNKTKYRYDISCTCTCVLISSVGNEKPDCSKPPN